MDATADTPDRPLRVALVVARFPVASETFVINMAAGLLARGHDVRIHAVWGRERGPAHELVTRAGLLDRVVAPPAAGVPVATRIAASLRGLGRSAGDLLRRVEPASVTIRGIPVLVALAQTFAGREDYDVIHAQFGPLGTQVLALREAGLVRGPILTHFRGFDASRYVRRHGPDAYRRLFAGGDLFLPNCAHFQRRLHELGCDPARTVILRSGIDLDRFPFRPPAASRDRVTRVMTVGRLTAKKGMDDVLRAVARLVAAGRDLELEVVGDGPMRASLERLAAELGVADRVCFTGARPQAWIVGALPRADIFVAASRTSPLGDEDGPVNTLKEAMATGVPCVGTRHGGIPELIEDGVTGVLVAEGDPAALADGIGSLLDMTSRWPEIAAAARARIERDYDVRTITDHLVKLYRHVAAGGRGIAPGADATPPTMLSSRSGP